MPELPTAFCEALAKASAETYGESLQALAIFGSWARGAATPESDIDLLVIAEPLPDGRGNRVRQFAPVDAAVEPCLAGIWPNHPGLPLLSPIFKTPSEVEAGSPLFLDMTLQVILLTDRAHWFANYLCGLRDRLAALGAVRRRALGGYFWDYKPDFKPGEVVRL